MARTELMLKRGGGGYALNGEDALFWVRAPPSASEPRDRAEAKLFATLDAVYEKRFIEPKKWSKVKDPYKGMTRDVNRRLHAYYTYLLEGMRLEEENGEALFIEIGQPWRESQGFPAKSAPPLDERKRFENALPLAQALAREMSYEEAMLFARDAQFMVIAVFLAFNDYPHPSGKIDLSKALTTHASRGGSREGQKGRLAALSALSETLVKALGVHGALRHLHDTHLLLKLMREEGEHDVKKKKRASK